MPTVKLTTATIKSFKYEGDGASRDVRWDAADKAKLAVPGLGLRIYPSGRKAFVLSYRFEGDKRMMVLGDFGTQLTLPQARERATRERFEITRGVDPIEEKRRAEAATTFGVLADLFIKNYAKKHKKTWATDEGRLKRHIPARWKNRKIKNITRDDIEALHTAIGRAHPYEANRTLDLLRVVFRQAKLWSSVDFDADNPAIGIKKHEERSRSRFLKSNELPALAKSIDAEPDVYHRAAVWLYLLTGLRKVELLRARWVEVDFETGQLHLPDTKSGEEQMAPLSGSAMAILQGVPRQAGNPFILPGRITGKHLVNIDKPWRRIRDRATVHVWEASEDPELSELISAITSKLGRSPSTVEVRKKAAASGVELPIGLSDLRIHDLRRSVGSWMTQSGVDLNEIKDALRHADIATTLKYAKLGEDPAREAFEAHGMQVMAAAGRAGPKEVARREQS
jgi:integrase